MTPSFIQLKTIIPIGLAAILALPSFASIPQKPGTIGSSGSAVLATPLRYQSPSTGLRQQNFSPFASAQPSHVATQNNVTHDDKRVPPSPEPMAKHTKRDTQALDTKTVKISIQGGKFIAFTNIWKSTATYAYHFNSCGLTTNPNISSVAPIANKAGDQTTGPLVLTYNDTSNNGTCINPFTTHSDNFISEVIFRVHFTQQKNPNLNFTCIKSIGITDGDDYDYLSTQPGDRAGKPRFVCYPYMPSNGLQVCGRDSSDGFTVSYGTCQAKT